MPPYTSQPIQPHANSVKNCRNASEVVAHCSKLISSNMEAWVQPYGQPVAPGDLSCYQGEIAFEVVGQGYPRSKDGSPLVMTCLNGLVVPKKDWESMRSDMQQKIRIVGPVIATTAWNNAQPSFTAHPVAVLTGTINVRNTGREPIKTGDIVLARLPPQFRNPQVPEDVSTPISDSRRGLETTPLRGVIDPFSNSELVLLAKNFVFQSMVSDICELAIRYGMEMQKGVANETLDAMLARVDAVMRVAILKAAPASGMLHVTNPLIGDKAAMKKVVGRMCKLLYSPPGGEEKATPLMARIGISSLNVAPYILSNLMAQIVGIAQGDAPANFSFPMMTTPTPQAVMNRFRVDA